MTSILDSKTNVSPILKQELTFTLSSEYDVTLLATDLSVQIKQDATNYSRDLYIMRVDNAASPKTFTVKFNGAPPGQYYFAVTSTAIGSSGSAYGRLYTSAISFQTSSVVSTVSPTSGSVFGGSTLTITGTNFSNNKEDLAVKVGDFYCDILTTTMTQITCQIRATGLTAADVASGVNVLVFLAASFEATCIDATSCKFEYVVPNVSVTSLAPGLDTANGFATATLSGTGFTVGDTSSISLFIDSYKQTTYSVDSGSVIFRITNMDDSSSSNIQITTAQGFPSGASAVKSITFTPAFFSISPNTGASAGGTLMTVKGTGFGLKTSGFTLKNYTNSSIVCSQSTVSAYGTLTCTTSVGAVASTNDIRLMKGTTAYSCSSLNTNACKFEAVISSSPTVATVSLSGSTLTFTGSNFPTDTSAYEASAVFKSATASVGTWTAGNLVAGFPNGLPAASSSESAVAKIIFKRKSDGV